MTVADPLSPAPAVAAPPAAGKRMTPVDLAWLRMDHPTNLMMINGVLVLAQPLGRDELAAVIEERLLKVSRFRQRVVGSVVTGRMRWEEDPDFDLSHHLHEVELPAPGGDAELKAAVDELLSRPLDGDRPLWTFHLIQNYEGGSAVMGRIHHSVGDGIALMMVLLSLTDRSPATPADPEDAAEGDPLNPFTALFTRGRHAIETVRTHAEELMPDGMKLLLQPVEALRRANPVLARAASMHALSRLALRRADPATVFKGDLGVEKRAAWSGAIPLGEMRDLAAAAGGAFNDVLLSAATGGLRRYMVRRGQRPEGLDFRAAVPVNLRPLEEMADLGNRFGLIFLTLPISLADPGERFLELRRRLRALKRSAEPLAAYGVLKALGMIPYGVQRSLVKIFGAKATAVMTSVPGPAAPLYLAGRRLSKMFFWVPQAGRVGLGMSILSYAGEVRFGVCTDAGLVPDPEAIVGGFYEELEALDKTVR